MVDQSRYSKARDAGASSIILRNGQSIEADGQGGRGSRERSRKSTIPALLNVHPSSLIPPHRGPAAVNQVGILEASSFRQVGQSIVPLL